MNKLIYYIAYIVQIIFYPSFLVAQTKVEVITKTVEKSFVYKSGYSLQVDGKSAKITAKGWDGAGIKVVMKLISKGLTADMAKKELEYQKYALNETNKSIVIRNYLLLPRGFDKLSTIQETEIQIYVPKNITLRIKNAFGETELSRISGQISIENEYGDIFINDLNGSVKVKSFFGDLKLNAHSGTLIMDISHTETSISGFSGSARINTNLGNVSVRSLGEISYFKVIGEKADITLKVTDIDQYFWNVRSKYGEIEAPNKMTKGIKSIKNAKVEYGNQGSPNIQVTTDFGKIEIIE